MTENEILQRIVDGFIPTDDVIRLAVLAILSAQQAYEYDRIIDHCGCAVCLLFEKVEDLGLIA